MQHRTHEVQQLPASAAVTSDSLLRRVDYADAFRVSGAPPASASEWARAVLEQAAAPLRASLRQGWKRLGLRPAARHSDAVLDWSVRNKQPDLLVLARSSWIGMPAELMFRTDADGLVFNTLVHLRHPLVRLLWAAIAPKHVRTVERLLIAGAQRLQS